MSALQILQGDFQDYILSDDIAGRPAIADAVREQFGLSATDRLAIYHRAYRARMKEALCEAYDKTWTFIGDAMFAELADSYVADHPSTQRNLRWFGAGFAAHARRALPDYPFIAELAEFEWTLGLAFDAPDAPALTAQDLAALAPQDWGSLSFGLHLSLHLLTMEWNAVALWQAQSQAPGDTAPEQSADAMDWLVWRSGEQPHFRSLPPLEAKALRLLAGGATFGAVCEQACLAADQAGEDGSEDDTMLALAGYLQHWLAQGLLTPA